jgi:hypothetical protein
LAICGDGVRSLKKKPQAKIGRELINQGASTNLMDGKRAPLSGHNGRIWQNLWRRRAIAQKKPQAKIGRELINQGASTNLMDGQESTSFRRLWQNLAEFVARACDRQKKTRPKLVGS